MPRRPKKPCSFPGCPNLTEGRYCDEHTKVMNDRYNKYERPLLHLQAPREIIGFYIFWAFGLPEWG